MADHTLDLRFQGLIIIEVDPVVANQRVGKDQDLVGIGLVRNCLLVTRHPCGEDHLTEG